MLDIDIILQGYDSDYFITQGYNASESRVNKQIITDVLVFKQEVPVPGAGSIQIINDKLVFEQSINQQGHYTRSITDYLIFQENGVTKLLDNVSVVIPTIVGFTSSKNEKNFWTTLISRSGAINLPNSEFGDSESNITEVMIIKAVGGRRYSHVKTSRRRKLTYIFNLKRTKALELVAFIDLSNLEYIQLYNWKRELWLVQIINNPVVMTAISNGWYQIKLEFEGYKFVPGNYKCLE